MIRRHAAQKPDRPTALLPIAVDVDLIRFEKNLLQIGFFGANDARDKNRTSRRIEQTVFRDGHKVKVAAEFRGSEQLGLPSTTDRDKFIALLKIVGEERAKSGKIANPVRFSGYRMIQELGLYDGYHHHFRTSRLPGSEEGVFRRSTACIPGF
jgi:hypothetical protein